MHNKEVLQASLEELFHKNQLLPRMREEFTNSEIDFTSIMVKNNIDVKFGFDLLVQMALHKRCNLETLVGLLRHHFGDSQKTVDEILKAASADLVDYFDELRVFVTIATIDAETQQDIDRYQYPLPMVTPPETIRTNKDTGYVINKHGSVILKDNHHGDDVCLDHLNRLNKVKLSINENVMTMVKNQWRNLDKLKEGESISDYKKRVKAFERYDKHAKAVMGLLLSEGNELYLTHKYDKRGRSYCQGYHVNYQGTAWNKAVIQFADMECI